MGNESYFKDYTLFKLILAVVHISVNYQKIHKLNCMKQRMPRKAMLKRLLKCIITITRIYGIILLCDGLFKFKRNSKPLL